jgi:hypothetical protein
MNIKYLLSIICGILGLGLFLYACTKTAEPNPNPADSYQYFPIEVGDYKLYKQVTFNYAVGTKVVKDTAQVKETVTSKTVNNSDTFFVIERTEKGKNDLFFKPTLVYQVIVNPQRVILEERNNYSIYLLYPLYLREKWNINQINGRDEVKATIVPYDSLPPKLITTKNLIKVQTDSTNNLINMAVNYTLFAKGIGPIYSEKSYIEYCQEDNCLGKYLISSGNRQFKTLLSYGKGQ